MALRLQSFLVPILEDEPQLSIGRHPYLLHRAVPQYFVEFGDQLLPFQRVQIALYPPSLGDERLALLADEIKLGPWWASNRAVYSSYCRWYSVWSSVGVGVGADTDTSMEYRVNTRNHLHMRKDAPGFDWARHMEYQKSRIRSKVEYVFLVIKRLFGYRKVRYRGLSKNRTHAYILGASANAYMLAQSGWCMG